MNTKKKKKKKVKKKKMKKLVKQKKICVRVAIDSVMVWRQRREQTKVAPVAECAIAQKTGKKTTQ